MRYIDEIAAYKPRDEREVADQLAMLEFVREKPKAALERGSLLAHITSSGFIVNPVRSRCLFVHHNIRDAWSWTGGHADGDGDLLAVALREAREETGIAQIEPLGREIASLDVLVQPGHKKNGQYVNTHLHLSAAYLLVCTEEITPRVKPDENSAVRWFDAAEIALPLFNEHDVYLYRKLLARAGGLQTRPYTLQ